MKFLKMVIIAVFIFSASGCSKNEQAPAPTAIPPPLPIATPMPEPTPTSAPVPVPLPTPTPINAPVPVNIPEPNFSLNQEGLLDVDLSRIKDDNTNEDKIKILADEFNKKGFLIYQIGMYRYDEESKTALFNIDFFYAAAPIDESAMHKIALKSLFVFTARTLEPEKIIIVDNDRGIIFIRRSPIDKMNDIKEGNFDPRYFTESPIFLKPTEGEIFYRVMPSTIELLGTPVIPGGILDFKTSDINDQESFISYFNELGRFNFKIIEIGHKKDGGELTIHLKLHYYAVRDKKTGEMLYEFTEAQKEELEIFTYQIVGSLMTSAAKIFNPQMIIIAVYNYDSAIRAYFSMKNAMDMLKKAGVDWKTYAQKFDLVIAVPKE